jgi:hypothetical protein
MRRFVEIRGYQITAGARDAFHEIFTTECVPLLERWRTDVVACGPSPHDDSSYVLIRAYASLAERQAEQDAFYGSDDWRKGPRERILERIATMTSVVLELDDVVIDGLRRSR